jgi:hypothetical protein
MISTLKNMAADPAKQKTLQLVFGRSQCPPFPRASSITDDRDPERRTDRVSGERVLPIATCYRIPTRLLMCLSRGDADSAR